MTDAQRKALAALASGGLSFEDWRYKATSGRTKAFGGFDGTVRVLRERRLVEACSLNYYAAWRLTAAGREALR